MQITGITLSMLKDMQMITFICILIDLSYLSLRVISLVMMQPDEAPIYFNTSTHK